MIYNAYMPVCWDSYYFASFTFYPQDENDINPS